MIVGVGWTTFKITEESLQMKLAFLNTLNIHKHLNSFRYRVIMILQKTSSDNAETTRQSNLQKTPISSLRDSTNMSSPRPPLLCKFYLGAG